MRNTRWMVLCLLIGFIMASAMMSTIPIYMQGSLQRMLVKDMESYQLDTGKFPGEYVVSKTLPLGQSVSKQREFAQRMTSTAQEHAERVEIPVSNHKFIVQDTFMFITTESTEKGRVSSRLKVLGMTDFTDHITITSGEIYENGLIDGAYEVICTEPALQKLELMVGNEYMVTNGFDSTVEPFYVRIVGTFENSDTNDSYWSEGMATYENAVMLDYDSFLTDILDTGTAVLSDVKIQYAYDYHSIKVNNLEQAVAQINEDSSYYSNEGWSFDMGVSGIFESYAQRAEELRMILWLLQIPVMIMLAFYLFMVSQLHVESERNEIAVFKSRGASSFQIFKIYAYEGLILGGITLIAGPALGLFLCKILGVSNGFLEFVNRPALPVTLSPEAYIYAIAAIGVFFFTTMIPIIPATKTSIVLHKQRNSGKKRMALWEKIGIDVIMLAGSLAWLWLYNKQREDLIAQGVEDMKASMNPILFVASTIFILGAGLLCIRIYPHIVRLLYKLGKRVWSPAQYVAMSNVGGAAGGRERFLMLFLILTVSLGLYSANSARAINTNMEDRTRYENGADVRLHEHWQVHNTLKTSSTSSGQVIIDTGGEVLQYIEPNFDRFTALSGVESATKVLKTTNVTVNTGNTTANQVNLMGVIPDEFAKISWFRDDLLPVHWYNYLNALTESPSGVVASKTFAENYGAQLGDRIELKWGDNNYFDGTIVAFIDYWPTFNPYEKQSNGQYKDFVVMNYNYVTVQTNLEPYQVWIEMEEGASSAALYESISDTDITLTEFIDTNQELIKAKNDPQLQGMNGALTLGFIIIMVMTIIGFLIYWILSIKSRTLQFGILRAMGVSFREIITMLLYEQLLVSGVAIAMAIVIGGMASDLFVPLFQAMYSVTEQVPPFRVIALRSDYIKVYITILAMLVGCFGVLGSLIKKIKISQAIKLGED